MIHRRDLRVYIYIYTHIASSVFLTKVQRLFEHSSGEGGGKRVKVHRLYIDCNRVIINVKGTNFDFSSFLVRAMNYFRAMIRFLTVVNRL